MVAAKAVFIGADAKAVFIGADAKALFIGADAKQMFVADARSYLARRLRCVFAGGVMCKFFCCRAE
jgi:hypothetical protein